jgi:hypothetical protein
VTACSTSPAGLLRGLAAGWLTASLATAAHAAAGGGTPSGASTAQLAVLAVVVGALSATLGGGDRFRVLLGLLSAGQLFGHLLLGAVGHHHGAGGPSGVVMMVAHVAAVACGAALIAAAGYLCAAVSRAVRAVDRPAPSRATTTPSPAFGQADQPLRSALLLAASISHRGPPVSAVR